METKGKSQIQTEISDQKKLAETLTEIIQHLFLKYPNLFDCKKEDMDSDLKEIVQYICQKSEKKDTFFGMDASFTKMNCSDKTQKNIKQRIKDDKQFLYHDGSGIGKIYENIMQILYCLHPEFKYDKNSTEKKVKKCILVLQDMILAQGSVPFQQNASCTTLLSDDIYNFTYVLHYIEYMKGKLKNLLKDIKSSASHTFKNDEIEILKRILCNNSLLSNPAPQDMEHSNNVYDRIFYFLYFTTGEERDKELLNVLKQESTQENNPFKERIRNVINADPNEQKAIKSDIIREYLNNLDKKDQLDSDIVAQVSSLLEDIEALDDASIVKDNWTEERKKRALGAKEAVDSSFLGKLETRVNMKYNELTKEDIVGINVLIRHSQIVEEHNAVQFFKSCFFYRSNKEHEDKDSFYKEHGKDFFEVYEILRHRNNGIADQFDGLRFKLLDSTITELQEKLKDAFGADNKYNIKLHEDKFSCTPKQLIEAIQRKAQDLDRDLIKADTEEGKEEINTQIQEFRQNIYSILENGYKYFTLDKEASKCNFNPRPWNADKFQTFDKIVSYLHSQSSLSFDSLKELSAKTQSISDDIFKMITQISSGKKDDDAVLDPVLETFIAQEYKRLWCDDGISRERSIEDIKENLLGSQYYYAIAVKLAFHKITDEKLTSYSSADYLKNTFNSEFNITDGSFTHSNDWLKPDNKGIKDDLYGHILLSLYESNIHSYLDDIVKSVKLTKRKLFTKGPKIEFSEKTISVPSLEILKDLLTENSFIMSHNLGSSKKLLKEIEKELANNSQNKTSSIDFSKISISLQHVIEDCIDCLPKDDQRKESPNGWIEVLIQHSKKVEEAKGVQFCRDYLMYLQDGKARDDLKEKISNSLNKDDIKNFVQYRIEALISYFANVKDDQSCSLTIYNTVEFDNIIKKIKNRKNLKGVKELEYHIGLNGKYCYKGTISSFLKIAKEYCKDEKSLRDLISVFTQSTEIKDKIIIDDIPSWQAYKVANSFVESEINEHHEIETEQYNKPEVPTQTVQIKTDDRPKSFENILNNSILILPNVPKQNQIDNLTIDQLIPTMSSLKSGDAALGLKNFIFKIYFNEGMYKDIIKKFSSLDKKSDIVVSQQKIIAQIIYNFSNTYNNNGLIKSYIQHEYTRIWDGDKLQEGVLNVQGVDNLYYIIIKSLKNLIDDYDERSQKNFLTFGTNPSIFSKLLNKQQEMFKLMQTKYPCTFLNKITDDSYDENESQELSSNLLFILNNQLYGYKKHKVLNAVFTVTNKFLPNSYDMTLKIPQYEAKTPEEQKEKNREYKEEIVKTLYDLLCDSSLLQPPEPSYDIKKFYKIYNQLRDSDLDSEGEKSFYKALNELVLLCKNKMQEANDSRDFKTSWVDFLIEHKQSIEDAKVIRFFQDLFYYTPCENRQSYLESLFEKRSDIKRILAARGDEIADLYFQNIQWSSKSDDKEEEITGLYKSRKSKKTTLDQSFAYENTPASLIKMLGRFCSINYNSKRLKETVGKFLSSNKNIDIIELRNNYINKTKTVSSVLRDDGQKCINMSKTNVLIPPVQFCQDFDIQLKLLFEQFFYAFRFEQGKAIHFMASSLSQAFTKKPQYIKDYILIEYAKNYGSCISDDEIMKNMDNEQNLDGQQAYSYVIKFLHDFMVVLDNNDLSTEKQQEIMNEMCGEWIQRFQKQKFSKLFTVVSDTNLQIRTLAYKQYYEEFVQNLNRKVHITYNSKTKEYDIVYLKDDEGIIKQALKALMTNNLDISKTFEGKKLLKLLDKNSPEWVTCLKGSIIPHIAQKLKEQETSPKKFDEKNFQKVWMDYLQTTDKILANIEKNHGIESLMTFEELDAVYVENILSEMKSNSDGQKYLESLLTNMLFDVSGSTYITLQERKQYEGESPSNYAKFNSMIKKLNNMKKKVSLTSKTLNENDVKEITDKMSKSQDYDECLSVFSDILAYCLPKYNDEQKNKITVKLEKLLYTMNTDIINGNKLSVQMLTTPSLDAGLPSSNIPLSTNLQQHPSFANIMGEVGNAGQRFTELINILLTQPYNDKINIPDIISEMKKLFQKDTWAKLQSTDESIIYDIIIKTLKAYISPYDLTIKEQEIEDVRADRSKLVDVIQKIGKAYNEAKDKDEMNKYSTRMAQIVCVKQLYHDQMTVLLEPILQQILDIINNSDTDSTEQENAVKSLLSDEKQCEPYSFKQLFRNLLKNNTFIGSNKWEKKELHAKDIIEIVQSISVTRDESKLDAKSVLRKLILNSELYEKCELLEALHKYIQVLLHSKDPAFKQNKCGEYNVDISRILEQDKVIEFLDGSGSSLHDFICKLKIKDTRDKISDTLDGDALYQIEYDLTRTTEQWCNSVPGLKSDMSSHKFNLQTFNNTVSKKGSTLPEITSKNINLEQSIYAVPPMLKQNAAKACDDIAETVHQMNENGIVLPADSDYIQTIQGIENNKFTTFQVNNTNQNSSESPESYGTDTGFQEHQIIVMPEAQAQGLTSRNKPSINANKDKTIDLDSENVYRYITQQKFQKSILMSHTDIKRNSYMDKISNTVNTKHSKPSIKFNKESVLSLEFGKSAALSFKTLTVPQKSFSLIVRVSNKGDINLSIAIPTSLKMTNNEGGYCISYPVQIAENKITLEKIEGQKIGVVPIYTPEGVKKKGMSIGELYTDIDDFQTKKNVKIAEEEIKELTKSLENILNKDMLPKLINLDILNDQLPKDAAKTMMKNFSIHGYDLLPNAKFKANLQFKQFLKPKKLSLSTISDDGHESSIPDSSHVSSRKSSISASGTSSRKNSMHTTDYDEDDDDDSFDNDPIIMNNLNAFIAAQGGITKS